MRSNSRVPWKSDSQIEQIAMRYRDLVEPTGLGKVDVVSAIEELGKTEPLSGLEFAVVPESEMLFAQAYTIGRRIFITASMLTKARSGDLSLRFGLAHELGHVVLHGDGITRPRLLDRRYVAGKYPNEESSEHQANVFAAAFLVPKRALSSFGANELARRFGVAEVTARIRLDQYRHSKPKAELPEVRELIDRGRVSERQTRVVHSGVPEAVRALFNLLAEIEGEDPKEFRRTWGNYRIAYSQYEKEDRLGWVVLNKRIYSWQELKGLGL